ncbi:hypothetical protein [Actinomadura alba]|uniref:Uncharacterized protein n=1 Tax=Actinomadura alba TaxID=406431 RepID=A0ABR7LHG4_9ACTN|nr:hypothetical protein [Actinomadura alba]MBC6464296.1 hypothetical protein [Actinomadura alba]
MTTLAAFRLGPHHGPDYQPYGVLSYSRQAHRHILTEYADREAAEAARTRIAHDADLSALLLCQSAGRWVPAASADARVALVAYAIDWPTGVLNNRQSEIKALLAACRRDRSPMWAWGVFQNLVTAMEHTDTEARDWCLNNLAPGGA